MSLVAMNAEHPLRKTLRIILVSITIMALASLLIVFTIRMLASTETPKVGGLELHKQPVPVRNSSQAGTFMRLKNIRFRLSDHIEMLVYELNAEAIPKKPLTQVNFDDVNSFSIDIYQGQVDISTRVMEYIFNNMVLNYKGAPVRNMKISTIRNKSNEYRLKVTGESKIVFWIPFEMIARLKLNKKRVLMEMHAETIKSLGNPYTKQIMKSLGLKLDQLFKVADGRGIEVIENRIIISPFALFPPPRIGGYIKDLEIKDGALRISFENSFKPEFPALDSSFKNYIQLYKGDVRFGKLTMIDANMTMVDNDSRDPFDFYLKEYYKAIARGTARIKRDFSITAFLPDYSDL